MATLTNVIANSTGCVGIGTTSPAYKLDVNNGNVRIKTTSNSDYISGYTSGANLLISTSLESLALLLTPLPVTP
mgnify:CR=1 FL=1